MCQAGRVVEALMKHGPRYTMISRETGVPVTTVRYIIREKLPKLGFTIRPVINYGRLGLQRYLVILRSSLSPDYLSSLLELLGETMYLNYYTYILNDGRFLTIFSIPPSFEDSFIRFLDQLARFNIIDLYDVKKLYYRRVIPFRADCFDFDNGVWIQNWEEVSRVRELPEIYEEPNQLDGLTSLDLRILLELYLEPLSSYTDIAKRLKISRQTVKRRFEKILSTIYLYMVFWMPRSNPELVCTPLFIQADQDDKARRIMLNIPFTHLEMKTEDSEYYYILFTPSLGFYKVLEYISEKKIVKKIDFLSMKYAGNFTFPHTLFRDRGGWLNIFEEGRQKILREVRLGR
jgi:DNA-binding Lrp family transcriptional regulator